MLFAITFVLSQQLRVVPAANKQLQRTVMDKVPRHMRQRAAAELRRYAAPIARIASLGENLCT
jgi:hypothetical protein